MAVNKRKKNTRQRGSHTHGWGSMKKHRGAGNRGGRGAAGSGKRGDQKKPSLWKNKKYFGKFGFKSKSRAPKIKAINIMTIEDRADSLLKKGLMKFENGKYIINVSDLGYNKLLSTGKTTKKFIITTPYATKKAVERIKKAGGDVKVLVSKAKKTKETKETTEERGEEKKEKKAGKKEEKKAKEEKTKKKEEEKKENIEKTEAEKTGAPPKQAPA